MAENNGAAFRLPNGDEHHAIVGRNGTGKSQFGACCLSKRDLRNSINVVMDYKREILFNSIPRIREIGFNEIPDKNGLYIIHGVPERDDDDMENWLWKVLDRENVGLFVDEGYMLPYDAKSRAFKGILTQGRSKRIPVITLSQRPVEISRFVFSEASHVSLFDLNDERDEKTVKAFTPKGFVDWVPEEFSSAGKLPKYFSRWYNIKDDSKFIVQPAPEADEIISAIDAQLEPKRRWL